jgi:hypothetical protein
MGSPQGIEKISFGLTRRCGTVVVVTLKNLNIL